MRRMLGVVLFVVGIILFFISIGLRNLLVSPVMLVIVSYFSWRLHYRRLAIFFIICAILALVEIDVWKLIMSVLFIYFGYRLLTNRSKAEPYDVYSSKTSNDINWSKPSCSNSYFEELYLGNQQFELKDIMISSGITNIHIDLSRAIIPEGETTIILNGMVGQVQIYLPYDLEASIAASVMVGGCEVLGKKQGGLKNQIYATTKGYEVATRKVKIVTSLLIAEVHVRYL